jgi:hypothetical protein
VGLMMPTSGSTLGSPSLSRSPVQNNSCPKEKERKKTRERAREYFEWTDGGGETNRREQTHTQIHTPKEFLEMCNVLCSLEARQFFSRRGAPALSQAVYRGTCMPLRSVCEGFGAIASFSLRFEQVFRQ